MLCYTYRSSKRDGVYLYLKEKDNFNDLPAELMTLMGKPIFMLMFKLDANRHIVKVDPQTLMQQLNEKGYYLRIDVDKTEDNLLVQDRLRRGLTPVGSFEGYHKS